MTTILKGNNGLRLCPAQMYRIIEYWLKNELKLDCEVGNVKNDSNHQIAWFNVELNPSLNKESKEI